VIKQDELAGKKGITLFLFLAFLGSFLLKVVNLKVGAPPQRMYLESWLCGLTSLATYIAKSLAGQTATGLSSNLVADAYQDYYTAPDTYAHVYRCFVLILDMVTAWMVYRLGLQVLGRMWKGWAAALAAGLYLFSYNTVWCDVVARPDVLVAIFSTTGLYFYFKSQGGSEKGYFYLAGVFLGISAGLKLHSCLFVVFICLDLLRLHGWRRGFLLALILAILGVVFFAVAAGIPLFDPLKYVKLRMLNVKDDESPWIQWGEQFYVLVKGSGWLVVPLLLWGAWKTLVKRVEDPKSPVGSVLLIAVCWVFLFLTIRQLRAYWMLPALPLFYIAFLGALSQLTSVRIRQGIIAMVLLAMVGQSLHETRQFHRADFGSLRSWIQDNVEPDEAIYIFGYEAVFLPKTEACREKSRQGIVREFARDIAAGETHVNRHLKNWEENSTLTLYDMLVGGKDSGHEYYSIFGNPLNKYDGILDLDQMQFVFVQHGFDPADYGVAPDFLQEHFEKRANLTGPGGGGKGLDYQVFARKKTP